MLFEKLLDVRDLCRPTMLSSLPFKLVFVSSGEKRLAARKFLRNRGAPDGLSVALPFSLSFAPPASLPELAPRTCTLVSSEATVHDLYIARNVTMFRQVGREQNVQAYEEQL